MKANQSSEIPCIDVAAQAKFEENQLLITSLVDLLKGKTLLEADSILNQCLWVIKTRSIIS